MRDYVPACLGPVPDYSQLEIYAIKRAKFNVLMIILYCLLTIAIFIHWVQLGRSPSMRQATDRYTYIMLALFLLDNILSIWNAAALI
jgi:hypothetical protein